MMLSSAMTLTLILFKLGIKYFMSIFNTIFCLFFIESYKLYCIEDFRYPPHGKRAIAVEKDVTWERIRAAPVDASPHNLYVSDSLNELKPGDHIEIQWRRNKEFPYGKYNL